MPTAKDSLDELKNEAIEDELNEIIKNSDYDGKKAKKIRDIASRYHHPDAFTLSPSTFTTPEMGDFYLGAIDDAYLKHLDEILTDKDPEAASARNAAFYTETPTHTELGFNENSVFVKCHVTDDVTDGNWTNGNALRIPIASIDAGSPSATGKAIKEFDKENPYANVSDKDSFTIQLYGMKAPQGNRYAHEENVPINKVDFHSAQLDEIKGDPRYVYDKNGETSLRNFVRIGHKFYEMNILVSNDKEISFDWLVQPGNAKTADAFHAQQLLQKYIGKADGEVYLQIDRNKGTDLADSLFEEITADASARDTLQDWAGEDLEGKSNGYCLAKQDAAARRSGVAYVKIDGKWINLAKAAIAGNVPGVSFDPSYNNEDNKDFRQDYDREAQIFADAYFKVVDEIDDRKEIQREVFGKSWEELHDWTVTLGDVTLLIPPTNISLNTTIESQRMQLLRAHGGMPKSGQREIRTLQMTIFFAGNDSINGRKYKTKAPKGQEFEYSINGLRSLIAQFKFTPFLPIENKYINETLGIHAVTFNSISLNNVAEVGPKLIEANIVLTEFDFSVYLPQVAAMCAQNNCSSNWFSTAINWPVMRYYYQRCITAGDRLGALMTGEEGTKHRIDVTSPEYIKESLKNRTALQPMPFLSSKIKFYIADQDYLEKMLEAKRKRHEQKLMSANLIGEQSSIVAQIAKSIGDIDGIIHGDAFRRAIDELNSFGNFGYKSQSIITEKTAYAGAFNQSGLVVLGGGETDPSVDADLLLNRALGPLLDKIKSSEGVHYARFVSNASIDKEMQSAAYFGIEVIFNDPKMTDDVISGIKNAVSPVIGAHPDTFFRHGRIFIPLSLPLEKDKTDGLYRAAGKLALDDDNADIKFLKYCAEQEKTSSDKNASSNGNGITSGKKATLTAKLDAMKYVPYDCGDFVVVSYGAQLANHQSRINLEDISGAAPQYLGGADTTFYIKIQTQSKQAVSAFSNAPKRIGSIMRRYREVIPCCPFRIDSEISRFLGVNEVTVQDVQVKTIEKQPGCYEILVTMLSTDRTLRNREAMERIEADNAGKKFSQDTVIKNIRSYFDFESMIAKAELYPDLELPRLDEMQELGWNFVRYKFQDARVYVDPDFYFVYLQQLSSQFLREAILKSIECGVDGSGDYEDVFGAQMTIKPEKFCGFTTENHNDVLKSQLKEINDAKDAKYKLNAKSTKENLRSAREMNEVEDYEGWDICSDIKAIFLEPRYKREYDSFIAREKAGAEDELAAEKRFVEEKLGREATDKELEDFHALRKSGIPDTAKRLLGFNYLSGLDSEGKWVAAQLQDAQIAAEKIAAYLKDVPIDIEVPDINEIRERFIDVRDHGGDPKVAYDALKTEIQNAAARFLAIGEVKEILELLNFDLSTNFVEAAKDIVFAAACAATGEKEFSNKKKSTNWLPAPDFIGVSSGGGVQDATNARTIYSVDEAIETATEFGIFKIRQYTQKDFIDATGESPVDVWGKELPGINESHYLLDRYYRYLTKEEIEQYKKGCINSFEYCTYAFLRNALYWLKVLIDNQSIPSINGDILRKTTNAELQIQKKEVDLGVEDQKKNRALREHIKFFSRSTYALDAGKLWTAVCLAGSDGSRMLKKRIFERDYRGLNEYIHGCSVPKTSISTDDKVSIMMRKMSLALIGQSRIKDSSAEGVMQDIPAVRHARDYVEKKYIEAAEDPKQYMLHACHDMIVHDARGRMLRAFPTYYLVFIDEGREAGSWRLHDNFYNSMAILEFSVVKDRKSPADTATIKLSNFYQSNTIEEEDLLRQREGDWGDLLDSVFSPDAFGEKMEGRRQGIPVEDHIRLRPGARIHLRAGYGSNAAMMPVIFNGSIAEVTAKDTVDIIAQGDGIELCNPIMEQEEGHDLANGPTTFLNSNTPKTIMTNLLNYDGGVIKTMLQKVGYGHLLGNNPFGIYHFGNKAFTQVAANGECTQNIFEAWASPVWGDGSSAIEISHAPEITFDAFGKTVWDIANICKSVMPDFICAVAPFNLRSTLFIGAPRYYYAYDYTNVNGAIQEKRKPYQQYHVYTSGTDIIGNGVAASSKKVKTTATGLYQVCATFNTKEQHTVGPLYADIDIYPEEQKSMIVDTQLLAKGVPFLGAAGLNMIASFDAVDNLITSAKNVGGDIGNFILGGDYGKGCAEEKSRESIAWRMTASALKDSIKDMYCGDMVVLGDPSVKPHDRIFVLDNYTGIAGQVTAKEVVHHMSIDEGFTTSISPDCINVVDDRFEHIVHNWFNHTGGIGAANLCNIATIGGNALLFLRGDKKGLFTLQKALNAMRPSVALDKIRSSELGAAAVKKAGELAKDAKKTAGELGKKAEEKISANVKGKKAVDAAKKMYGALKTLGRAAVGGAAAGAAGGPIGAAGGAAAAVAGTIAMCLAQQTVGTYLSNCINSYMRNLQVITVFPLKRYGLSWTAGLQGSKGMIFGAPSYDEQGPLTSLIVETIDNNSGASGLLASCFFDDSTRNIARSLKRSSNYEPTGIAEDIKDMAADAFERPGRTAAAFTSHLYAASGAAIGTYNVYNDYRRMQMIPRADFSRDGDVMESYNYFKMTNAESFQNDPKLQRNILISEDLRLKPYLTDGFFKIVHQYPNLDLGNGVEQREITINGSKKCIKAISYQTANGAPVLDIPLLNQDALDILFEIVRRTKNLMPAANSSDPYEAHDEMKNSFVLLESALRVGDIQSYASTGFTFILRGVERAAEPMRSAIKALHKEIADDAEEKKTMNSSLFDATEYSGNKFAVTVRMPRVSFLGLSELTIQSIK